ncbi:MAG TPA: pentapeptide repeat-containing protein [Solirubrobacteraceae bacterium]|nr:pentapeptide repeat-containing protein [Solirubrobacteraceae bacterium]
MRPDAPDLPPELDAVTTLDREGLEAARLTDAAVPEFRAPGVGIDACVLERVVLAGARMTGAHVRDTQLSDCDLANADLRDARLRRVEVHGGRLTGAVLIGADLGEPLTEDCRADFATFATAHLHNVRLAACDLRSTDWQEAQLRGVCFEDCDLSGADFSRGRFVEVELRRCRLDGIRGAQGLRGVTMSWDDVLGAAAVFAAACGVRVRDE